MKLHARRTREQKNERQIRAAAAGGATLQATGPILIHRGARTVA